MLINMTRAISAWCEHVRSTDYCPPTSSEIDALAEALLNSQIAEANRLLAAAGINATITRSGKVLSAGLTSTDLHAAWVTARRIVAEVDREATSYTSQATELAAAANMTDDELQMLVHVIANTVVTRIRHRHMREAETLLNKKGET